MASASSYQINSFDRQGATGGGAGWARSLASEPCQVGGTSVGEAGATLGAGACSGTTRDSGPGSGAWRGRNWRAISCADAGALLLRVAEAWRKSGGASSGAGSRGAKLCA